VITRKAPLNQNSSLSGAHDYVKTNENVPAHMITFKEMSPIWVVNERVFFHR